MGEGGGERSAKFQSVGRTTHTVLGLGLGLGFGLDPL